MPIKETNILRKGRGRIELGLDYFPRRVFICGGKKEQNIHTYIYIYKWYLLLFVCYSPTRRCRKGKKRKDGRKAFVVNGDEVAISLHFWTHRVRHSEDPHCLLSLSNQFSFLLLHQTLHLTTYFSLSLSLVVLTDLLK